MLKISWCSIYIREVKQSIMCTTISSSVYYIISIPNLQLRGSSALKYLHIGKKMDKKAYCMHFLHMCGKLSYSFFYICFGSASLLYKTSYLCFFFAVLSMNMISHSNQRNHNSPLAMQPANSLWQPYKLFKK